MTYESGAQSTTREPMVYVIDDDEDLRRSLCWLLEGVGISALDFGDADSFFESFDPDAPACVIVDVRMPQVSGFQIQEHLQDVSPAAQVIFCSAHGDIAMSVKAMQQGAVTFLEKPYDSQAMIDVVQRTVGIATQEFAALRQRQTVEARLSSLTAREREVLRLVVEGMSSQNIARRLGTSVKTIDVHRGRIKSKSDAESIGTLVHDILHNRVQV